MRPEVNETLVASIRRAERLVIYEGLPHQHWERTQYQAEKQTKPTFVLHGYDFYKEPPELSADDTQRLREIMADERSFVPFRGEKRCGGFHPDYAVEWSVDGNLYRGLICFGCYEVKLYGPNQAHRNDIAHDAHAALKQTLGKYRKNRPEPKPED